MFEEYTNTPNKKRVLLLTSLGSFIAFTVTAIRQMQPYKDTYYSSLTHRDTLQRYYQDIEQQHLVAIKEWDTIQSRIQDTYCADTELNDFNEAIRQLFITHENKLENPLETLNATTGFNFKDDASRLISHSATNRWDYNCQYRDVEKRNCWKHGNHYHCETVTEKERFDCREHYYTENIYSYDFLKNIFSDAPLLVSMPCGSYSRWIEITPAIFMYESKTIMHSEENIEHQQHYQGKLIHRFAIDELNVEANDIIPSPAHNQTVAANITINEIDRLNGIAYSRFKARSHAYYLDERNQLSDRLPELNLKIKRLDNTTLAAFERYQDAETQHSRANENYKHYWNIWMATICGATPFAALLAHVIIIFGASKVKEYSTNLKEKRRIDGLCADDRAAMNWGNALLGP